MSTGAGKSLCFQLPAICLPGVTFVISPLIALMADQLRRAEGLGIPSVVLSSELQYQKRQEIMEQMKEGKYKLVFITPERVDGSEEVLFSIYFQFI